jgi:hypothetical protein
MLVKVTDQVRVRVREICNVVKQTTRAGTRIVATGAIQTVLIRLREWMGGALPLGRSQTARQQGGSVRC